jgi:hypothetical protein
MAKPGVQGGSGCGTRRTEKVTAMRVLPRRVLARSAVVAAAACAVVVPTYVASATARTASPVTPAASAATAAAVTSSSACGASFTLTAKTHASTRSRPLVDVRAGRHTCYDRLVLEFRGPVNGYNVRYVKQVSQDGSGKPVPLAGRAALQVTVVAPAYDANGRPTYRPADPKHVVDVRGFASFRQVAWAGSYEGYTTLGVGVRRSLPFRVFILAGPGGHSRLVVDVAHR